MEHPDVPCFHPWLIGVLLLTVGALGWCLLFRDSLLLSVPKILSRFSPVLVTALLCLWTMAVCPFSKYGDNWAIVPALVAPLVVLTAHIRLSIVDTWSPVVLWSYALVHAGILFPLWILCLMLISKDGL